VISYGLELEAPTTNQNPKEVEMEYSTVEPWQTVDMNGVVYDLGSLYDHFNEIGDPRKERGKRYSLETLLVLIFTAKMSGADSPSAIAEWNKERQAEMVDRLHLSYERMPHHNTYRRVFANVINEEQFEEEVRKYRIEQQGDGEIHTLLFDGKRERGTIPPGETQGEAFLAVYSPEQQAVMVQERIETEESEIPAAQRALEQIDLSGKLIMGDAMHTHRALSEQIVQRHGDYLWTVKENEPNTYHSIEVLFAHPDPIRGASDFQTVRQVNKGHGRIEERTLTTSLLLNSYLDWPKIRQVFQLERRFTFLRKGQTVHVEQMVHYGITSLPRQRADAGHLLDLKRSYWQIETGLHYRRDVTFREDHTRMSHPHATRNLATIHNTILALFAQLGLRNAAQARRFFDAHPDKAFALLLSAHPQL
jgi:predicted transposase YbfD/YdcC